MEAINAISQIGFTVLKVPKFLKPKVYISHLYLLVCDCVKYKIHTITLLFLIFILCILYHFCKNCRKQQFISAASTR